MRHAPVLSCNLQPIFSGDFLELDHRDRGIFESPEARYRLTNAVALRLVLATPIYRRQRDLNR